MSPTDPALGSPTMPVAGREEGTTSAALSVGLGVIAWAILALARSFSGGTVAASVTCVMRIVK